MERAVAATLLLLVGCASTNAFGSSAPALSANKRYVAGMRDGSPAIWLCPTDGAADAPAKCEPVTVIDETRAAAPTAPNIPQSDASR